jgi:hypothetical protein
LVVAVGVQRYFTDEFAVLVGDGDLIVHDVKTHPFAPAHVEVALLAQVAQGHVTALVGNVVTQPVVRNEAGTPQCSQVFWKSRRTSVILVTAKTSQASTRRE